MKEAKLAGDAVCAAVGGRDMQLHPALVAGGDDVVKGAACAGGEITVPPYTTAVFVEKR